MTAVLALQVTLSEAIWTVAFGCAAYLVHQALPGWRADLRARRVRRLMRGSR